MKIKSRGRAALLLGLLGFCLLLSACWDKRELSDTAIVLGVGLDAAGDSLRLSVELAGPEDEGPSLFSVCGEDAAACAEGLEQQLNKTLFWADAAALLYGGGLTPAQLGDSGLILYLQLGLPGRTPLLDCGETTALQVLEGSFGQSEYVGLGLAEALTREREQGRESPSLAAMLENELNGRPAPRGRGVSIDSDGVVSLDE